jgi:hypothetical protein
LLILDVVGGKIVCVEVLDRTSGNCLGLVVALQLPDATPSIEDETQALGGFRGSPAGPES